jgi:hypothetical protein
LIDNDEMSERLRFIVLDDDSLRIGVRFSFAEYTRGREFLGLWRVCDFNGAIDSIRPGVT